MVTIIFIVLFAITIILGLLGRLPWERALVICLCLGIAYGVFWYVAVK